LDCTANWLASLENLPKGLKELRCHANKLTTLEGLPEGLEELYCSFSPTLHYIEPSSKNLENSIFPDHLQEKYSSYSELHNSYVKHQTLKRNIVTLLALKGISLSFLEGLSKSLDDEFKTSF